MSFKSIAVSVAVAVLLIAALDAFIVYRLEDPLRFAGHALLRIACLAAAAISAGITAARYHWWNEYVGRAWTLLFLLYALITVSETITRFAPNADTAGDVAVIVGNLAAVGAFWLFGRALQIAGLQFYGSRAVKIAVFLVAVAIACALILPTLADSLKEQAPALDRASGFISAAADMITFILVAPLLLTVWSLRGGLLSWVYGFLALSTFGWMINQASDDVLPAAMIREGQMTGFILACASVVAAAYLQRTLMRPGAAYA